MASASSSSTTFKRAADRLANPTYRHAFTAARARRTVSAQIKALRQAEGRKWTQGELGLKAQMKQGAIARLENPDYGNYTLNTLLRLAEAFDVSLSVRFVPFSEAMVESERTNLATLTPASYMTEEKTKNAPRGILESQGVPAFPSPNRSQRNGLGSLLSAFDTEQFHREELASVPPAFIAGQLLDPSKRHLNGN